MTKTHYASPNSPTPKLVGDEPEYDAYGHSCESCPMLERCQARIELSETAWVMCEIPDERDLQAAEAENFPFVAVDVS